jgi:hypothetical protein
LLAPLQKPFRRTRIKLHAVMEDAPNVAQDEPVSVGKGIKHAPALA